MLINLKPLFTGKKESLSVDCTLDFSELEFQGVHPFRHPVRVAGEVSVAADIVTLHAAADFVYEDVCDRCLTQTNKQMRVPIEHVLVTSLTQENDDEFVLVENYQLPLDDLVREDLLLSLPTKNLCREDCRGLCPTCGKDLGAGLCSCRSKTVDPRLAVLKQLTDESE